VNIDPPAAPGRHPSDDTGHAVPAEPAARRRPGVRRQTSVLFDRRWSVALAEQRTRRDGGARRGLRHDERREAQPRSQERPGFPPHSHAECDAGGGATLLALGPAPRGRDARPRL